MQSRPGERLGEQVGERPAPRPSVSAPPPAPEPARDAEVPRRSAGPAPRNSEFLTCLPDFPDFPGGDFKPQKLLLFGGFKLQLFV